MRLHRTAFWPLLVVALVSAWWVVFRVDLTPQVERDFFFSTGDPAFQATKQIEELFPAAPQIIIAAVGDDLADATYLERVAELTEALLVLPGVDGVQSLTRGPRSPAVVADSPLWSRFLLTDDPRVSQLIVTTAADADESLVRDVEALVEHRTRPSFDLRVSGVPYVVAQIRRNLTRDLKVFSLAAFAVFGLVITALYRRWAPVVGTLFSCLAACLITLAVLDVFGTPIGVLTANLATIVFVLTLSHTVFLTANWRRARAGRSASEAVDEGVRITFSASFWCMVAALLGFGSLLLANAKPLRELGTSGLAGTAAAIIVAYGLYPRFLRLAGRETVPAGDAMPAGEGRLPRPVLAGLAAILVLALASGLPRIETDPDLLTYFAPGSELRAGLAFIDRTGGSSPLDLVVADPAGRPVYEAEVGEKLAAFQADLDEEPAAGVALSLPVLLAEARTVPFAALIPAQNLIDLLDSPQYEHVARNFVDAERQTARFFLRMREGGRTEARQAVVARIEAAAEARGLDVRLVGGLYDLQAKLGELVRGSLLRELGGLLFFFIFVAAAVARSGRTTAAMVACLAAVPVLLLGGVGHLGTPIDVIAAPGANVAIALGIDAMIHLVMAVRRRRRDGLGLRDAWALATVQMRQPIVGAMLILAVGFGIFALSSFPPTRRFGILVATGTLVSAFMALAVLPVLATARRTAPNAPS